jgi:rhodanese-related sulfurtransferase
MWFRYLITILLILTTVTFIFQSACSNAKPNTPAMAPTILQSNIITEVKDLSVKAASEIILENADNPEFFILDVRTPEEYNSGHIANAINIDSSSLNFNSAIGQLSRDKTYLVYCQMGGRSATATKTMRQLGFKNVFNMTGGLAQWVNVGYPTKN